MKKLIIIVLVIGVIICGGLLYLFLDKRANDNAAQTAQDLPLTTQQKSTKNTKSQKSTDDYLVIKEWNVRMKLPEDVKDATYIYDSSRSVWLTTKSALRISGCENSALTILERIKKGEKSGYGQSVEDLMNADGAYHPIKIGEYYYFRVNAEGGCANNPSQATIQKINSILTAYTEAIKTLKSAN